MRRSVAVVSAFLSAAGAAPNPAVPPGDTAPAIEAVWLERRSSFDYVGFTTAYTCDSLRDKLIDLLRFAGARRDLEVTASGCESANLRVSTLLHARLHFHSAMLPKVGENPSSLPVRPALAHWSAVQIAAGHPRSIARGDCELIEQFEQQLLKHFEVRSVASELHCVPHQLPSGPMRLRFEVLSGTHTSQEESIQLEQHPPARNNQMKSDRKPNEEN